MFHARWLFIYCYLKSKNGAKNIQNKSFKQFKFWEIGEWGLSGNYKKVECTD